MTTRGSADDQVMRLMGTDGTLAYINADLGAVARRPTHTAPSTAPAAPPRATIAPAPPVTVVATHRLPAPPPPAAPPQQPWNKARAAPPASVAPPPPAPPPGRTEQRRPPIRTAPTPVMDPGAPKASTAVPSATPSTPAAPASIAPSGGSAGGGGSGGGSSRASSKMMDHDAHDASATAAPDAAAASPASPQPGSKSILPYLLGAGALVALPVAGPVAALALAVGAGVSLSKKKKTAAQSGLSGAHMATFTRNLDQEVMGLLSGPDCDWALAHQNAHRMGLGAIGASSPNVPAKGLSVISKANNDIAALLHPFYPIIDHIPNPPYYAGFTADLKTRPVDALINLMDPLNEFLSIWVWYANDKSSVKNGGTRQIGLPGHKTNVVMGLDLPAGTDPSAAGYIKRAMAINNFLILAYQDPAALAKGCVAALVEIAKKNAASAQWVAQVATGFLQNALSKGVALAGDWNKLVVEPDNSFAQAMVNAIRSQWPQLQPFADAKAALQRAADLARQAATNASAAAQAAAQQAQADAAAAAAGLARVIPIMTSWNAFLSARVGPQNALLVREVYANGDTRIKNDADAIKGKAQYANHDVPPGIRSILDQIVNGAEAVKSNASNTQGWKDNNVNLASALVRASLAPGQSKYRPEIGDVVLIPTTFAGMSGVDGLYGVDGIYGFRGLGITGAEEAAAFGVAAESAGTVVVGGSTGGTVGTATAPATTPGIAGMINNLLAMFVGQGVANTITSSLPIPGGGGGGAAPVITKQLVSKTVHAGDKVVFSVTAGPAGSGGAQSSAQQSGQQPTGGSASTMTSMMSMMNGDTAPAALAYEWQAAEPGSSTFTKLPDSTNSPTYTIPAGIIGTGQSKTKVRVKVSSGSASVLSEPATLTVLPAKPKSGALPIALAAGALVALPVAGPVVALALAAGAAASFAGKKKTPDAGGGVAGLYGVDGVLSTLAIPQPRVIALGAMDPGSDPLAQVANGSWKIKIGDSGAGVVAAKALLRSANYGMTDGSTWTSGDLNKVTIYQRDHGLPVTNVFDAATLSSLRPGGGRSTTSPTAKQSGAQGGLSTGAKVGIGLGLTAAFALALKK